MYTVCVFGSSSDRIDSIYLDTAERLGEGIAARGMRLVFGGGSTGVMGAVSRGAARQNGTILGVVPKFFVGMEALTDRCEIVFTETMRERKAYMEDNSDVFVVCPGGIGTFEELFEILTLKQLRQLEKPIIIYNINGYYTPLLELLQTSFRERFITPQQAALCEIIDTEDEVFARLEAYAAREEA